MPCAFFAKMNLSKVFKKIMLGIAGIALVTGLAGMARYKTNISMLPVTGLHGTAPQPPNNWRFENNMSSRLVGRLSVLGPGPNYRVTGSQSYEPEPRERTEVR
jgi:hypothetical protein